MVVVHVDDTNVSFWVSLLVTPVIAPAVEISSADAPAVLSTYERWRNKEDPLLPGGSTQILEASIFDAADSLVAELRLCYLRSSLVQYVVDDLMATFDVFAASL